MANVARKLDHPVARPLKVLVPLIQDELTAGTSAGLEHYRRAGEMLVEARDQVPFHGWGRWLSKNFELSDRTARAYMRLAQSATASPNAPLTVRQAMGHPAGPQPSERRWQKIRDATRKLAGDEFKQERQQQDTEIGLHREIALQLIDIGYRALATRLHPDRGGSKEAMMRLNRVRDELKAVAETRRFL
jgi:hypothetical protein